MTTVERRLFVLGDAAFKHWANGNPAWHWATQSVRAHEVNCKSGAVESDICGVPVLMCWRCYQVWFCDVPAMSISGTTPVALDMLFEKADEFYYGKEETKDEEVTEGRGASGVSADDEIDGDTANGAGHLQRVERFAGRADH